MTQSFIKCLLASALIGGVVGTGFAPAFAQSAGSATGGAQGAPAAAPSGSPAPAGGASSTAAGTGSPSAATTSGGASTPSPVAQSAPAPTGTTTAQSGETLPPGGGEGTAPNVGTSTQAATVQTVPDAYLTGEDRLPPDEIQTFLAQPRLYIDEQPVVAERVSARTERLAGSDARTVPPIINAAIAPETTAEQRAMIALGLARSTRAAESLAPEYAAYIQVSVAESGSEGFIAAYNVAFQTTEIQTASIGTGTGTGGASASGGTLSGGGDSGISGAIGGDDVVPQVGPTSRIGAGRSVIAGDDDGGTTTVFLLGCIDSSPALPGCTP